MQHNMTSAKALLGFFVLLFAGSVILSCEASVWYISPFGSDETGSGSESSPFQTLFFAVGNCKPYDTIVVMPGIYAASGTITTPISIEAQEGPHSTSFTDPGLDFGSSQPSSFNITGITFYGATYHDAIQPSQCGNTLNLVNCHFVDNYLAIDASCWQEVNIENSVFSGNRQDISSSNPVTITNCTFLGTGGISSRGVTNIASSLFLGSSNSAGGPAITASGSGASLTVKDSKFSNCSTSTNGGAVLLLSNSAANFESCVFEFNSATGSGGGIYIQQNSMMYISNSDLQYNTAKSGGAYACDSTGRASVENCSFNDNTPGGKCLST